MSDSKANIAEKNSFEKMKTILGDPQVIASPMGSAAGFPDYGFRLKSGSKNIDIHVEYKLDSKAQMGSMRDWIFDGKRFFTSKEDPNKEELLSIMNSTPSCVEKAKQLLEGFQKHFDPSITNISSGMLTIIKEQNLRRAKLINFVQNTPNYQIAKINDAKLGTKIIDHYKKKFKANLKPGANGSVLMMVIGNQMYLVDIDGQVSKQEMDFLTAFFGVDNFVKLNGLVASLEVRIQPRGLNSPGKPVSIDVMASFRLNGLSGRGTPV